MIPDRLDTDLAGLLSEQYSKMGTDSAGLLGARASRLDNDPTVLLGAQASRMDIDPAGLLGARASRMDTDLAGLPQRNLKFSFLTRSWFNVDMQGCRKHSLLTCWHNTPHGPF